MIGISVFTGGQVLDGPNGLGYSVGPATVFSAMSGLTFADLSERIYRELGLDPSHNVLIIDARINIGQSGHQLYFQLIPIRNDDSWTMVYNMTVNSGMVYKVLDLYVVVKPVQRNRPVLPSTQDIDQTQFVSGPNRTQNVSIAGSSRVRTRIPSSSCSRSESRVPSSDHAYDHNTDEDPEEREAEENWDATADDDSDRSDVDTDVRPVLGVRHLPISGRGTRHPIEAFNDISAFEEADVTFFANCQPFDNAMSVGQQYESKEKMKEKIQHFHINSNIEIKQTHSDKTRLRYKCKSNRCNWSLVARSTGYGDFWTISKNAVPHTCFSDASRLDHSQLTSGMVANCIKVSLRTNVDISIRAVRDLVEERYPGIVPKYNKLWRGRELAIARQFGSWEGSYGLIIPLLEAIKRANPGTKYKTVSKPTGKEGYRYFMRAAWAWGPCIDAVTSLRPIITIDACFLSGRYKGKLLIACAYDADNQLFPLAFGLVETEDFDNWGWFMRWLRDEVIGPGRFMCVISDRHKGIKKVFQQNDLGWSEDDMECVHRLCSQHIAENMRKNTNDKVSCKFFKIMVHKKKPRRYQEGLEAIRRTNPSALEYLDTVGKYNENDASEQSKPWKVFQSLDGGYRWGIMTTNGSESLNNVFRNSRRLPVAAIIEDTFYKCVSWFVDRRATAEAAQTEGQIFCSNVHKMLNKRTKKTENMRCHPFGNHGEFEVVSLGEKVPFDIQDGRWVYTYQDYRYRVLVKNQSEVECSCQKPQLTGIPCVHVLSVCRLRNYNENTFVNPYYSISTQIHSWSGQFHVYDNQNEWPRYDGAILVPEQRLIKLGRRRHNRVQMWMDILEGRTRGHQASRETIERNARNARNARS